MRRVVSAKKAISSHHSKDQHFIQTIDALIARDYAVASTEPAVEMRVLSEADQSISGFLSYMWTALVESGGSNVSRENLHRQEDHRDRREEGDLHGANGKTIEINKSGARIPKCPKAPEAGSKKGKGFKGQKGEPHQGWEGQQRRRDEEWVPK